MLSTYTNHKEHKQLMCHLLWHLAMMVYQFLPTQYIVSLIKNNAPGPFAKDDYDAAGQTLGTWLVGDLLVILDGVQTVVDLTTKVTIMPATTAASITMSTSIHITGSIITSTVWVGTGTPSLPDATMFFFALKYFIFQFHFPSL
jgi:hypothetical protein